MDAIILLVGSSYMVIGGVMAIGVLISLFLKFSANDNWLIFHDVRYHQIHSYISKRSLEAYTSWDIDIENKLLHGLFYARIV